MEQNQDTSEIVLEIKDLNFSFGTKSVLNNFSFALKKGHIHGILGDNGAGKTSLFNILYGTLKTDHPGVNAMNRNDIAFLETDTFLYSYLTGMEYLELINDGGIQEVTKWNKVFELPLSEYAHNYSTGMKKKLLLLSVLLLNKNLIILDEPFNGLDLKTCEVIHSILRRLKEVGKTVILSSHILETVIKNADEISYLEEGTIIKTYSRSEFNSLEVFIKNKFRDNIESAIDQLIV